MIMSDIHTPQESTPPADAPSAKEGTSPDRLAKRLGEQNETQVDLIQAIPVPHVGRWIAAGVIAVLAAMGVPEEQIESSIRLSWGAETDEALLKTEFAKLLTAAKVLVQ